MADYTYEILYWGTDDNGIDTHLLLERNKRGYVIGEFYVHASWETRQYTMISVDETAEDEDGFDGSEALDTIRDAEKHLDGQYDDDFLMVFGIDEEWEFIARVSETEFAGIVNVTIENGRNPRDITFLVELYGDAHGITFDTITYNEQEGYVLFKNEDVTFFMGKDDGQWFLSRMPWGEEPEEIPVNEWGTLKDVPSVIEGFGKQIIFKLPEKFNPLIKSLKGTFFRWCDLALDGQLGIPTMIAEWSSNKAPLIEAFEAFPEYDGDYRILVHGLYREHFYNRKNAIDALDAIWDKMVDLDFEKTGRLTMPDEVILIHNLLEDLVVEKVEVFDEETRKRIMKALDSVGSNIKVFTGQSINKLFTKWCALTNIAEWKVPVNEGFYDNDGEWHDRFRDHGFSKYRNMFCDNTRYWREELDGVLSINPVDFLLMSYGYGWSSCHRIGDFRNDESRYGGCYRSGCTSYMLDGTTMLFYTIKKGQNPETARRYERTVLHFGEDKLIQEITYGDKYESHDVTNAVLPLVEQVFEVKFADEKQYNSPFYIANTCNSTHYPDYDYNRNHTPVFKVKGSDNHKRMFVGHAPICPLCGRTYSSRKSMVCDHCNTEDC